MAIKTDYAALADRYAQHRQVHPAVLARLVTTIDPADRVLEVGCGTGNYISTIQAVVGCQCVGLDPSPEMLAKLVARGSPVRVVEATAERLGLADQSFDLIYSVDVIHHVSDRDAAYREALRVLKPGGRACTVTDSDSIIRQREPLATYFPEIVDIELGRYPSIDELRREMLDAGFESLREETVEHTYELVDATAYRAKVFSSLLFLSEEAFQSGLERLEADLRDGPISCTSRYLMVWVEKR